MPGATKGVSFRFSSIYPFLLLFSFFFFYLLFAAHAWRWEEFMNVKIGCAYVLKRNG